MNLSPKRYPAIILRVIVMPAESRKRKSTQVFKGGKNPPRATQAAKKSRTTKSPRKKTPKKAKARAPLQEIVNEADHVTATKAAEAEQLKDEDVKEQEMYPEDGPSSAQPGPFTQQLDEELAEVINETYVRCRYRAYCNNKTVDGVEDSNYKQLLSSLTAGEVWRWADSVVMEMST
ncbi:hypothetical protein CC80DRAFT_185973 [Byssothecium circinans]|uniref:Uncharacterized protein n=1 Tax=Byssothecium circinans TaxID=147558 RepID=A0A6A5TIX1_9PLEO|nr:hypothetical protein CC80DRAFT_185973 [Byssothecium circinans]